MASAVVIYLDCEHYTFLHATCETKYKIISVTENKCVSECEYKSGIFKWKQTSTTEYISPATLKQYDIKIKGFGFAILANLFDVKTTLQYYYNDTNCQILDIEKNKIIKISKDDKTLISEIFYEIEMPFFIYPFRKFLKNRLENMKIKKDIEDLDFIKRRVALFGSDKINSKSSYWFPYLRKNYFFLFKERFMNNFFTQ
tara:strand:- start:226 stop:822 length:597 start_codon:yes stop_codon:yes gene_type:complete